MSGFLKFLRANSYLLAFGIVLTFFSSYGQTFLISLYIPELGQVFGLSNTGLSSLYAIATMASAFSLPWLGRLVDTAPLRKFTFGVLLGLMLACLLLSFAIHPIMVVLDFLGLRLFGQGLMTHTSISTMARAFVANRGKAISIAALGHPLGEALLPLLIAFIIASFGWRMSLQLSALSLLVLVFPFLYFLLKRQSKELLFPSFCKGPTTAKQKPLSNFKRAKLLDHCSCCLYYRFLEYSYLFLSNQAGNSRGWDPAWVAGSLSVYALASALAMMGAGPLVDRLSAREIISVHDDSLHYRPCLIGFFGASLKLSGRFSLTGLFQWRWRDD